MQPPGTHSTLTLLLRPVTWFALIGSLSAGCVSHIYAPGTIDNPLHAISLGQTYDDMIRVMGEPDHSHCESRMGEETFILFIPLWNIIEAAGDFNPSAIQVYTYDRWGTVTIDNNNRIIRIEGKSVPPSYPKEPPRILE